MSTIEIENSDLKFCLGFQGYRGDENTKVYYYVLVLLLSCRGGGGVVCVCGTYNLSIGRAGQSTTAEKSCGSPILYSLSRLYTILGYMYKRLAGGEKRTRIYIGSCEHTRQGIEREREGSFLLLKWTKNRRENKEKIAGAVAAGRHLKCI